MAIFLPMFLMITVTFVVWIRMFLERKNEIISRKISFREVNTSSHVSQLLKNTQAADNFKNLFELPVLFYILCVCLLGTNVSSPVFIVGLWAFAILRGFHSYVHCTYNRFRHR